MFCQTFGQRFKMMRRNIDLYLNNQNSKELSKTFLEENNLEADYAFEIWDPETKIFFQDEEWWDSFIKISVELDPNDFSLGQKVWIKSSNDQVSRDNLWTYPVQQKLKTKRDFVCRILVKSYDDFCDLKISI